MKSLIAIVIIAGGMFCNIADATVVFSIGDVSTNFGENGANSGDGFPFLDDNGDGTFTLGHDPTAIQNNAVYVGSSLSVDELAIQALGRAINTTDTVVVSGTVVSSTINPNANGLEFGLAGTADFRTIDTGPNLLFQIDADGQRGGRAAFFGTPFPGDNQNRTETPGAEESSLVDGFSFRGSYSPEGITWTVTDIITENEEGDEPVDATSLQLSYTDVDYESNFLNLVGGGFAYFSTQRSREPVDSQTIISAFQIEVLEPSAGGLLCDLDADGDCDPADLDLLYQTASPDIPAWLSQAEDTENPWKVDSVANPGGAITDSYTLGDVNLDGDVNSVDLGLLLNNFNNTDGLPPAGVGWAGGDLNADGNVNSVDLGQLLNGFGFTSSASAAAVPEPSSGHLLLLAFGSLIACRVRGRRK